VLATAGTVAAILLMASCSGDEAGTTTNVSELLPQSTASATTVPAPTLSDEARDWCRLTAADEASADRFDLIFEAGLNLRLNMDAVNATAGGKRFEYEEAGMSPDEAVRAVSDDLFDLPAFVEACQAAFETYGDG